MTDGSEFVLTSEDLYDLDHRTCSSHSIFSPVKLAVVRIQGVFLYNLLTIVSGNQPPQNSWLLKENSSVYGTTLYHLETAIQKTTISLPGNGRVLDLRLLFYIQSIPL